MRLDQLELELRPRPNAQALDLGYALLRSHAADAYAVWLLLWLPLVAACGGLAALFPQQSGIWLMLAWWLRPLLERAPLYVFSRRVFGEATTWQQALRAWPRQLGGGWLRLLIWRPFVAGRGFYQPIWQLEGARGKQASERYKVLAKHNTASSAFWFGVVCAHFEVVLQLGLLAFIGIFMSKENAINPFSFLIETAGDFNSPLIVGLLYAAFAFGGAVVGPIYTACCFTLYLNRRATLEAWDIEIALRQIKPPPSGAARPGLAALAVPVLLVMVLGLPGSADAADRTGTAAAEKCEMPDWMKQRIGKRTPDQSAAQAALRAEVGRLFESEDLRFYSCEEHWVPKRKEPSKPRQAGAAPDFSLAAALIRALLIAAALGAAGWLAYRYREKIGAWLPRPRIPAATEIGGLDIRAESLPDDVAGTVRQLWANGERRAALALLYRASLSRLANQDGLFLSVGATEADCLRAATQAHRMRQLADARLQLLARATGFWLNGAYGNSWPDQDTVSAHCTAWHAEFGAVEERPR